jgi:DNA-binding SARP family transcriptional activator
VAGTAALAGLVIAALARRRRARSRSSRPGDIVEPRLRDDIVTERALAAAAGDVVDIVGAASRALGVALTTRPDIPALIAMVVAPSRQVTLHLAEPAEPIPPFETGPASDRWELYLDDLDYWNSQEPSAPVLDTLTCLGRSDADEWVFVDLESLGAVELAGDPTVAAELAQSMVAELSLQPVTEQLVDLTVIGVDELSPSVVEQGVVNVDHLDSDLVRRFEHSAEQTNGFLDGNGLRSTAQARARGAARDGLFVTVVAYGGGEPADPVLLERLAAAATPGGRGVAVVAVGPLGAEATRLIVTDDGRAHIPRLGITVTAARLTRNDLDRVASLLDREPEVPTPNPHAQFQPPPTVEVVGPYIPPAWRYCVRIFADHQVETDDGDIISFRYGENPDVPNKNTHRGPELLAYLALSGRAASATDVRDHLWWDRPVALGTVNKLLYGTRKVLGGADVLSLAQDDPVGRYRLSPEVVTDVELLSHALEYAHAVAGQEPDAAIELLRLHLARVEAVAFRSSALGQGLAEWAAAYRVIDRVEQPVIDASLLDAKLLTDKGPEGYREALWAIDQGLNACPVNEALVRAAMEIEARLGSTDAVNHRYLTLATKLARDELEPEAETSRLRSRLGAGGTQGRGGRPPEQQ